MDNKLVNLEIKVLEIKKPEIFFPEVRLNKDIKKRISLLPKEIQKKIYIYCFRFFLERLCTINSKSSIVV